MQPRKYGTPIPLPQFPCPNRCGCTGNPRALCCFGVCQPARQGNGDKGISAVLTPHPVCKAETCRSGIQVNSERVPGSFDSYDGVAKAPPMRVKGF